MIWWVLLALLLILSAFFSGSELAWLSHSAFQWEIWRQRYPWRWRLASFFLKQPRRLLITLLTGNNLALVAFGWGLGHALEPLAAHGIQSFWVETLLGTGILFIGGEYLPKVIAHRWHRLLMPTIIPLTWTFYLVLSPLVEPLYRGMGLIFRWLRLSESQLMQASGRESLRHIFRQEAEPGFQEILERTLHLGQTPIRDIMVPRHEIVAVDLNTPPAEALSLLEQNGVSRLIVYEGDLDQVRGYVYVRALLQKPPDLASVLQDLVAVPESMPASKLLELLVREKRSIALVVDARGGTAGLVTTEDLVEEVFGEIQDEHDQEELLLREERPGVYIADARWEIDALNARLRLWLPAHYAVTLGGLAIHFLRHIPQPGQTWKAYGLRWTVLKATRQRLQTLKLEIL